ncbi:hypothetical protein GCM10007276_07940 [Agaricicola taiwanensis]|uniref:PepSY domain-containing protein n=1 Tax=Agaricicola taiwanensis TaxID=591372 RepID=A0A8J2YBG5_9RHOB|nr:PepSY domain-containing protein [Agaricicola taiwanensis]GGE33089.1 hypothetical protein GCM10007276_07940 [Agaricicola taiwanensis]
MRFALIATAATLFALPAAADFQDRPPQGAKMLSEIVSIVEKREKFAFIDEIDIEKGIYEITYFMTDGAEVKLHLDARTGQPPSADQATR